MYKSSLFIALFGVLVCLSTARLAATRLQAAVCPRRCVLAFRCSPYYKDIVWSIVDGQCRVFQNGCLFASENCSRVNSCKKEMTQTTREECVTKCPQICPFEGRGVCGSFPEMNANNTPEWKSITFLNECVLNQYACQSGIAYVGMTEGECARN
ncbi:U-Kazal-Dg21.2 [Drosophila grimshawi]|uniref:U-Kazal-Dg21.2 n=1 Tax=Drosophila grimshawi TaxID=7222 RepID=UPI000C86E89A|nr:U-Kazal-Dg21.2 [Drosophila grimshawi]